MLVQWAKDMISANSEIPVARKICVARNTSGMHCTLPFHMCILGNNYRHTAVRV